MGAFFDFSSNTCYAKANTNGQPCQVERKLQKTIWKSQKQASFLLKSKSRWPFLSWVYFFVFVFWVVNNISIFVLNEFYDFLLGLIMICIVATKRNVSLVYSNLCIGETSIRYRLFFIGSVWFDLLMELYSHADAAKYTFMILLHFKSCRLGLTLNAVLTS